MENLKNLVKIKSDKNGDEIIKYLENRLKDIAEEIKIIENETDKKKSILVGLNTALAGIDPHRVVRTH